MLRRPHPRRMFAPGFWLGLVCWASTGAAWASIGTVTHVSGVLHVSKPSGGTKLLAPESMVDEGDVLTSETKSFARIRFHDGGNLLIRPNSTVAIEKYRFDKAKPESDEVSMNLLKGGMRTITGVVGKRSADKHTTITATATVGIRGTHFGLQLCVDDCQGLNDIGGQPLDNGLHIDLISGQIIAANPAGKLLINSGEFAFVRDTLSPPVLIPRPQGFLSGIPPSMTAPTGEGSTVGQDSNDNICRIQ